MDDNYRDQLFSTYNATHVVHVDPGDQVKLAWFRRYAERYYLPHLQTHRGAKATVLDIGCNKGYLLAALSDFGYQQLFGIDLSPVDLEQAKVIVPQAEVACTDAFVYLESHPQRFDVILIKAVLEHIRKPDVLRLLEQIHNALKPGGTVIVDVPNMDWLFAPHERYMDFTHEVGFTPESLRQVMSSVFTTVEIYPVDSNLDNSASSRWKKRAARALLGRLLRWADSDGARTALWERSLLGVGQKLDTV
jgi:2-polyprenyl-3-methyl-5-hydroxy-6-metoxy-1,4-benzoquinol methylase